MPRLSCSPGELEKPSKAESTASENVALLGFRTGWAYRKFLLSRPDDL